MQTFRKLRERNCYYVDKTPFERLLDEGTHYFLSRPRRFGKSLFLDTLKEVFEGSEELFAGLHLHAAHNWSQRHPVVRLDFAAGSFKEPASLHEDVTLQLESHEDEMGISPPARSAPRDASAVCCRCCTARPGSQSSCWSTSTTSRSWMRWRSPPWRAPTVTTCAASTA